jgi:hypothetical protein
VLAITPAPVSPSAGQTASALRKNPFAAQWLACTLPCRRFAPSLAADNARLGADVGRYSFIAVDFHHLLLAGLPAHLTGFLFPDERASYGCPTSPSAPTTPSWWPTSAT